MRTITSIILHCTATRPGQEYPPEQMRRDHQRRGFRDIGYHYYVRRDGTCLPCRPLDQVGAHCQYHNRPSIGICYEGGLNEHGQPQDTRTPEQRQALLFLLRQLKKRFPRALILGHHDLNPLKACPSFDAAQEYADL